MNIQMCRSGCDFPSAVATGVGGVVFGVKDATHFYAAVVDLATKTLEVSRVVDGKETSLGRSSIMPRSGPLAYTANPTEYHPQQGLHRNLL